MANPHRFYIPDLLPAGSTQNLPGPVAHHIRKVLRLRDGDSVHLWNGDGAYREATLHFQADGIAAMVTRQLPTQTQPVPQLTLIQALPEGDKMDWIIEKACEAGVDRIVPVQARRSVVRLSAERAAKRFEHWQRVAIAACSQCGRARLPLIEAVSGSSDTFEHLARSHALGLLLSPAAKQSAGEVVLRALGTGSRADAVGPLATPATKSAAETSYGTHAREFDSVTTDRASGPSGIALAIGPEGGWDAAEESDALRNGFTAVRLAGNTLRTETAGLYVVAQIRAWAETTSHTPAAGGL